MEDFEPNLEVADPDSFGYNKDEGFSHQMSVTKAEHRAMECLGKEMREGFWEDVIDKKGNIKKILHEDTRREAIEAVKTFKNVMIADLEGTQYSKNIIKILNQITEGRNRYLGYQQQWFNSLPYPMKQSYINSNPTFNVNYLNEKLPYSHDYLNYQVEVYREVFEQLELCLAGCKYFKKQKNVAGVGDEDGSEA